MNISSRLGKLENIAAGAFREALLKRLADEFALVADEEIDALALAEAAAGAGGLPRSTPLPPGTESFCRRCGNLPGIDALATEAYHKIRWLPGGDADFTGLTDGEVQSLLATGAGL